MHARSQVDLHYPHADVVRVVLDNLSTHSPRRTLRSLSGAQKPTVILRRLEFHFTPKHASWLNMTEIEIGVLRVPVPRPAH